MELYMARRIRVSGMRLKCENILAVLLKCLSSTINKNSRCKSMKMVVYKRNQRLSRSGLLQTLLNGQKVLFSITSLLMKWTGSS